MVDEKLIKFRDAVPILQKKIPLGEASLRKHMTDDPENKEPMMLHSRRLGKGKHHWINKSEVERFIKAFTG